MKTPPGSSSRASIAICAFISVDLVLFVGRGRSSGNPPPKKFTVSDLTVTCPYCGKRPTVSSQLKLMDRNSGKPDYFGMATTYMYAGDKERALTWLQRAFEERSFGMVWLGVDPAFDGLCSQPPFRDLLDHMDFFAMNACANQRRSALPTYPQ